MKAPQFRRLAASVVALMLLAVSVVRLPAVAITWTNAAGGLWETPGNWNPNQAPSIADAITLNLNVNYFVYVTNSTANSFPNTMTIATLSLGNGATDAPHLVINYTNASVALHITNSTGTAPLSFGTVGAKPVMEILSGAVVVDGTTKLGNTTASDPRLLVNGGVFSSVGSFQVAGLANSTGTVIVSGGAFYLTNAASTSDIWFGQGAGSLGSLIVSGGVVRIGTPSTASTFALGQNSAGQGQLLISGGSVDIGMKTAVAANLASTTGLVLLTGGSLTATNLPTQINDFDYFSIGNVGAGTMVVSNQGVFTVDRLGLGRNVTGIGLLTVTEGGRVEMKGKNYIQVGNLAGGSGVISNVANGTFQFTTNNPSLAVGNGTGTGFVINSTIEFKGVDAADLGGKVSTFFTYQGTNTLRLIGATNKATAAYSFQTNGSAFSFLDLAGANSAFQATNLTIGAGARVTGTGTLLANNATNLGTLAPGHSAGVLAFSSNLTLLSSSILNIEIGGTNAVDFDRLIANGTLTLGGTLNVILINSFSPSNNVSFDIIDGGLLAGSFATPILPSASWSFSESTGILSFTTIPEPGTLSLLALAGFGGLLLRRRRWTL